MQFGTGSARVVRQARTGKHMAGRVLRQDRAEQAGQGRTGEGRAGQGRAGQGRAGQGRAGQVKENAMAPERFRSGYWTSAPEQTQRPA